MDCVQSLRHDFRIPIVMGAGGTALMLGTIAQVRRRASRD
jgi:hypothetical protein